jgi:hypothetical protein
VTESLDDMDDRDELLEEQLSEYHALFGPSDGMVLHALIPLFLGGQADVLTFPSFPGGIAYVTEDLVEFSDDHSESHRAQQIALCVREPSTILANALSSLGKYFYENLVNEGDTIGLGDDQPHDVSIRALIVWTYAHMTLRGRQIPIRMLTGITQDELDYRWTHGPHALIDKLRQARVYPFTDLHRRSVLTP